MQDYKRILVMSSQGQSQRSIAATLRISRNTVASVLEAFRKSHLKIEKVMKSTNYELESYLYPERELIPKFEQPNMEHVHQELLKQGVTLTMLWKEYCLQCEAQKLPAYGRTMFFDKYHDYVQKNNLTMHLNHKPGERLQVDWAGTTMTVQSPDTGEKHKAFLFVATLPFSMYTYVEAFLSMNQKSWLTAHVNAFRFFDGVPKLIVPDNLKTGVVSNRKNSDPVINKAYLELADYYDVVIMPARVRKPRDKASVEGAVGNVTRAIIGKLRDIPFFSIEDLNKGIWKQLEKFNDAPFQKRDGSRSEVFFTEERDYLNPLPPDDYDVVEWKTATVQMNYHVQIDKMNYSVPYEFVGKKVEVKVGTKTIDIYYKGRLITSHSRLFGRRNQYSTDEKHMPRNHQMFKWNADRFRKWASNIGPSTLALIEQLLSRYKVEEQAYKGCLSILKLSDKFGKLQLEQACSYALQNLPRPTFSNIRLLLMSGQGKDSQSEKTADYEHANVRGADYYGGER